MQVSLGEGVTVDSVTVASPTALLVKATADSAAELGVRDVTVDELSFTGAFELASPVQVQAMQGQVAQGSVVMVKLQNLDFANPFDTTTTGDGFFTPLEYVNIAVTAGTGATAQISSVEPYSMDILLLTDVTAAAGVVRPRGPERPGAGSSRASATRPPGRSRRVRRTPSPAATPSPRRLTSRTSRCSTR